MSFRLGQGFLDLTLHDGKFNAAAGRVRATMLKLQSHMERVSRVASLMFLAGSAAASVSLKAYAENTKAAAKLESVLLATKNSVGFTADELKQMAADLQKVTTFEDETVMGAQALLASFKRINGDTFVSALRAAMDLSAVLEQDLQSSAALVGRALNDPLHGLSMLARAGVQFTDAQKAQIKAMVEAGDVTSAQGMILDAIKAKFEGAAEAAGRTFYGRMIQLKNAIGEVSETLGGALAPRVEQVTSRIMSLLPQIEHWVKDHQQLVSGLAMTTAGVTAALIVLPKVVAGATAMWTVLKGLKIAVLAMGGPLTVLVSLFGLVAAAAARAAIKNETFSESVYRMARAVGFFNTAAQNLGDVQERLGGNRQKMLDVEEELNKTSATDNAKMLDLYEQQLDVLNERRELLLAELALLKDYNDENKIRGGFDSQIASIEKLEEKIRNLQGILEKRRELKGKDDARRIGDEGENLTAMGEEDQAKVRREFEKDLMSEDDKGLADLTDSLDARADEMRKAGLTEREIWNWRMKMLDDFETKRQEQLDKEAESIADHRQDVLNEIELIGKDEEEQQRIRLQQQRDAMIKEAQELGLGQEKIDKIREGFAKEIGEVGKDEDRESARFEDAQSMFRRIQEAAASRSEGDDAQEETAANTADTAKNTEVMIDRLDRIADNIKGNVAVFAP